MKRLSIRILVAVMACAGIAAFASVRVPMDAKDRADLPAVALEQVGLYRLEVALVVFYGGLLLITPAFSGLVEGHLPIEISTRGAKFAGDADESAEATKAVIADFEKVTRRLSHDLTAAELEIKQLEELVTETTRNQR